MSDFLSRLVQRTRGEAATVRPVSHVVTAPDPRGAAWDEQVTIREAPPLARPASVAPPPLLVRAPAIPGGLRPSPLPRDGDPPQIGLARDAAGPSTRPQRPRSGQSVGEPPDSVIQRSPASSAASPSLATASLDGVAAPHGHATIDERDQRSPAADRVPELAHATIAAASPMATTLEISEQQDAAAPAAAANRPAAWTAAEIARAARTATDAARAARTATDAARAARTATDAARAARTATDAARAARTATDAARAARGMSATASQLSRSPADASLAAAGSGLTATELSLTAAGPGLAATELSLTAAGPGLAATELSLTAAGSGLAATELSLTAAGSRPTAELSLAAPAHALAFARPALAAPAATRFSPAADTAALSRGRRDGRDGDAIHEHNTTVEVSIGRIEVRLPPRPRTAAGESAPSTSARRPAVGLAEYLSARDTGKPR